MRRGHSGQALVEFSLVFPVLFFLLVGSIDLFRIVEVNTTVAEAARQGARQAVANQANTDRPFGATDASPCEGTAFTTAAAGAGCLTDARIRNTVATVLGPFDRTTTLYPNTSAASCPNPGRGSASVCVAPIESGAGVIYPDCASAKAALGHDPNVGDLGSRENEWRTGKYKGCFLIQVTVVYSYDAITPVLASWAPNLLRLTSTTTMLTEY